VNAEHYRGVGDALRKIVAEDGVAGLYRGVVPAGARPLPVVQLAPGDSPVITAVLLVTTSDLIPFR
jgi:hypothetical protein